MRLPNVSNVVLLASNVPCVCVSFISHVMCSSDYRLLFFLYVVRRRCRSVFGVYFASWMSFPITTQIQERRSRHQYRRRTLAGAHQLVDQSVAIIPCHFSWCRHTDSGSIKYLSRGTHRLGSSGRHWLHVSSFACRSNL